MNVLVISGGSHPYDETTPVLLDFLEAASHEVTMTEDARVLASEGMTDYDALVFNTRREAELTLTEDERVGMTRFIGGGGGFVCIHIAGCRPESWPEYHDVTGGGWITGSSAHPPYGRFTVNVSDSSHPCVREMSNFVTDDELYAMIAWKPGNEVFLTGEVVGEQYSTGGKRVESGVYPLGWTRGYGNGKVFVTTLGHDGLSFQTPEFQQLVLNGLDWAAGGP